MEGENGMGMESARVWGGGAGGRGFEIEQALLPPFVAAARACVGVYACRQLRRVCVG